MENKKSSVLIILLIIMILGLSGYIVYDKFILSAKEERQYTTVIDDVSIDINKLYRVGETLNKLDKAFSSNDSKYFGYIYNKKELNVKNFDIDAAIYLSINDDLIRSNTEQNISNERVKNKFEKIFGKSLAYTPTNIDLGDNLQVNYDEANKIYRYIASITNNDHKSEYLARNMKTTLTDDLVIITRKVFFVEYSNNTATIYSDSSKQSKLGDIKLKNGEVNLQEVTGKYGSKLGTYEITFKIGSDDEYNLYKIERTK